MRLYLPAAQRVSQRDWPAFDAVFTADVTVNHGGAFELAGRDAVVEMIRSMLGGCGPTQHLLGNIDISAAGEQAASRCYVRAIHAGTGDRSDVLYEVWAEYRDTLVHTPSGWRIARREMHVTRETGDRGILGPG